MVFSNTISHIDGQNVRVERGSLVDAVNELKGRGGKDLLVYGGATFVSSLIEHRLIDESGDGLAGHRPWNSQVPYVPNYMSPRPT